jgi:hypothetical protein
LIILKINGTENSGQKIHTQRTKSKCFKYEKLKDLLSEQTWPHSIECFKGGDLQKRVDGNEQQHKKSVLGKHKKLDNR